MLERLVGMEEALPELNSTMQQVGALTESVTGQMQGRLDEIRVSDARAGGAAGRLSIAARFGTELDDAATRMEELAERYESHMRAVDPGVSTILAELDTNPGQIQGEVIDFLKMLVDLGPTFSDFVDRTTESADAIMELGRLAIPLRKPSRRYSESIRRLSRAGVVADNWSAAAARLLPANQNQEPWPCLTHEVARPSGSRTVQTLESLCPSEAARANPA